MKSTRTRHTSAFKAKIPLAAVREDELLKEIGELTIERYFLSRGIGRHR